MLNGALCQACDEAGVREMTSHGLRRATRAPYAFEGAGGLCLGKMGPPGPKATARWTKVHELRLMTGKGPT